MRIPSNHCPRTLGRYTTGLRGTPVETDEAVPMWVDIGAIPYDEMWEDDRIWLPLLLEWKQFSGYWIFDGDRMLDYRLDVVG